VNHDIGIQGFAYSLILRKAV